MGNHNGNKLDYRQETSDEIMDRAKVECDFTERLYDILLAHQTGQSIRRPKPGGFPPSNVGELNEANSRLYNLIWASAVGLNEKAKSKKKQKQREVIA